MIKLNIKKQSGQSILEVIVAMAIFALISAALATMAVGSFNALIQGGEYSRAEALAQEALEAIKSIKDKAWNEGRYDQTAITALGGSWTYEGEGVSEEIDGYTRFIFFNDVCRDSNDDIVPCPGLYNDIHAKEVVAQISWESGSGKNNIIERKTYITNWNNLSWKEDSLSDFEDGEIFYNTATSTDLGDLDGAIILSY